MIAVDAPDAAMNADWIAADWPAPEYYRWHNLAHGEP